MPTVRVEPSGIVYDLEREQTIMAGATAAGYVWPTVCGGQGTCHTCFLEVVDGVDQLSPVGKWEREGLNELAALGRRGELRLACQAQASGDVVVRKSGVRPARPVTEVVTDKETL